MSYDDIPALITLRRQLVLANADNSEYVIFGSTPLILRGILERQPGDVDVFVSRRLWGRWLAMPGWDWETPKAQDPPILYYNSEPAINAFFDWTKVKPFVDPSECFASAELTQGFMCASTEEILKHKQGASADLSKHISDIEAIKESL